MLIVTLMQAAKTHLLLLMLPRPVAVACRRGHGSVAAVEACQQRQEWSTGHAGQTDTAAGGRRFAAAADPAQAVGASRSDAAAGCTLAAGAFGVPAGLLRALGCTARIHGTACPPHARAHAHGPATRVPTPPTAGAAAPYPRSASSDANFRALRQPFTPVSSRVKALPRATSCPSRSQ